LIGLSNDDVYKDLLERREIEIYNLSDLNSELRFEAEHFQKKYCHLFDLLSKKKCEKLGSLVSDEIKTGHTPSMKNQSFYGGNYHFIKTDNLRTNEITEPFSDYLSLKGYETLKRVHLKSGDIIVTIIGATYDIIARCALINEEILPATINQNIAMIRPDKNKIVPEYLVSYMNSKYGRMCLEYLARQMEQVNLNCQEIAQDTVPILSGNFQTKIKGIVNRAYTLLQRSKILYKQAESDLIGALSLDAWIPSPEQISVRSFKDISEVGRIDAEYYQPKYDELIDIIKVHNAKKLYGEIADITKSIEPGSEEYQEKGIPFYRVSDFSNFGLSQPDIYLNETKYGNCLMPKKDTVLLSKDGSVCIAYKVDNDVYGITSSALLHLRVTNTDVLPDYLALVLNSSIVKLQAEQAAGGSIIRHWRMEDIKNVLIPVIDKKIQGTIANKVQESFQLRKESTDLLASAKRAVEIAIEQDESKAIEYLESVK
jgi:hypothetical protein